MEDRLDKIDKRILYYLVKDARNTSANMIAEEMKVSPGTIRNRISQLEKEDVIEGYSADINYNNVDNRLMNLFICSSKVSDTDKIIRESLKIPGVVNIKELMGGTENLLITAVGKDIDHIKNISNKLDELGLKIENSNLLRKEYSSPYSFFGPEKQNQDYRTSVTNFINITNKQKIVEITIKENFKISGKTISEAAKKGILDDKSLIINIERNNKEITPKGNTKILPEDIITVLYNIDKEDDILESIIDEENERTTTY